MTVERREKKDTLFSIVPFDPLTSPFGGSMEEFMALGFVKRVSSSPPPNLERNDSCARLENPSGPSNASLAAS